MKAFVLDVQIRWSDLDPNNHMRHSVYYDLGALSRIQFFNRHDLTVQKMQELHFGPILFKEECIFRRELVLDDPVTINLEVLKAKRDYSRWSIQHTIMKNPATVSAILTVEGAWIDTMRRKLTLPHSIAEEIFSQMPLHKDFQWIN